MRVVLPQYPSSGLHGLRSCILRVEPFFHRYGLVVASVFPVIGSIMLVPSVRRRVTISALIWAGIIALYSAFALYALFIRLASPRSAPRELLFFYGVTLGIGIWWLVLF